MARRSQYGRAGTLAVVGGAFAIALAAAPAGAVCVGDCDDSGMVGIAELVTGVNIALGLRPVADCPEFACTGGDTVPINCLVQGVNNALGTCPADSTPTVTAEVNTPTVTAELNTPTVTAEVNTPTVTAELGTPTITPEDNTPTTTPVGTGSATATPVETTPVGVDTPTPTATVSGENTPTATVAVVECPLEAGRYTITQMEGGKLQVASIAGDDGTGFPFPAGGVVRQDVGPGDANCVHQTVVPADDGFSSPVFCIPGLNFTVLVSQIGCGIGQIDSDGGSDYTVTELGDTSDNSTCNLPAVGCPPGPPSTMMADRDASVRVDITVGNDAADTCPGGGTANSIVVIPVSTRTWLDSEFLCPDPDGMFDGGDTPILLIQQNLDFTTDVSTSSWSDIDDDGCSIAGAGPAAGLTRTGTCIDTTAMTVTTAATGTIGSDGSPLFDLTFATLLPNALSGPTASGGATCDTPPIVNFAGTATRCIE